MKRPALVFTSLKVRLSIGKYKNKIEELKEIRCNLLNSPKLIFNVDSEIKIYEEVLADFEQVSNEINQYANKIKKNRQKQTKKQ